MKLIGSIFLQIFVNRQRRRMHQIYGLTGQSARRCRWPNIPKIIIERRFDYCDGVFLLQFSSYTLKLGCISRIIMVTWTIIIRQFTLSCLLLLCLGAVLTNAFPLHTGNKQLENENEDQSIPVSERVSTN